MTTTPTKSLDPDQNRVYNTEHQLQEVLDRYPGQVKIAQSIIAPPVERRFGDIPSIQRYVDAVAAKLHIEGMIGPRLTRGTPTVVLTRGVTQATYNWSTNQIRIPDQATDRTLVRWAMRETVVLHEIAHWMTPQGAAHGREFQSALLWLLDTVIGPEAGFVFRYFLAESISTV